MAGLDLEETARKVGTRSQRLESWESGLQRPSIVQLRKLADIYKRPFALFFLEKLPPDDPAPRDYRRLDPQAGEAPSPALRLAIRAAHVRREAALELYGELEEDPPEFDLSARINDDPEKVGERLRRVLLADREPPRGEAPRAFLNFWRASAESAGILVFQAEDVDVEEMRGFSIAERPLPAVVLNIKDDPKARCFSLLHEIAHVMLNRGGLCIFEEKGPQTDFRRTEVFCNHVAGAALVPASSLLQEPEVPRGRVSELPESTIKKLEARYGASREAVLRRLVILGRVPEAYYRRKREEYLRAGVTEKKQRTGGVAPPYRLAVAAGGTLFTRLVLDAFDEERITASDVAQYLGVRLKHLERIREVVRIAPPNGGRT